MFSQRESSSRPQEGPSRAQSSAGWEQGSGSLGLETPRRRRPDEPRGSGSRSLSTSWSPRAPDGVRGAPPPQRSRPPRSAVAGAGVLYSGARGGFQCREGVQGLALARGFATAAARGLGSLRGRARRAPVLERPRREEGRAAGGLPRGRPRGGRGGGYDRPVGGVHESGVLAGGREWEIPPRVQEYRIWDREKE